MYEQYQIVPQFDLYSLPFIKKLMLKREKNRFLLKLNLIKNLKNKNKRKHIADYLS